MVGGTEAIMALKHLVGIAIAIAVAIVSAGAVGISAVEHSATQVSAKRVTLSKEEFRLNDHQRLRKMLLGQEHIVPQR
jgi:ATP-dependent Clp protease ATP-binding subunit ClpA